MHHSINLTDQAFQAYQRQAKRVGLTVDEYINQSAPGDDGFVLTPEMRAEIEIGIAQIEAGETVSFDQVREGLAEYRAEWLKNAR